MLPEKLQVKRQFDRSSASYDRVASMQRQIIDDLLIMADGVVFGLDVGAGVDVVADLGCGTGYGLLALQQRYPQAPLLGVDLAPGMVVQTKKSVPDANIIQGDLEALPLDDALFSLSFSSSVVQWCDIDRAVGEMVRVTVPQGWIAVSTFCEGTLTDWRRLWSLHEPQRFLSVEAFKAVFHRAGLTDICIETKQYEQRFYTFHDAVASIRDLGAGNASSDRAQGLMGLQRFKAIVSQIENIITARGYISLPYKVAFAIARKA